MTTLYFYEANAEAPSTISGRGAPLDSLTMGEAVDSGRVVSSVAMLLARTGADQMVWVEDRRVVVRFRCRSGEHDRSTVDGFAAVSLDRPSTNQRLEMIAVDVTGPDDGVNQVALFAAALAYAQSLAFEKAAANVMMLELDQPPDDTDAARGAVELEQMMLWNSRVLWWESIGPDPNLERLYHCIQERFSSKALHDQSLAEISLMQAQATERCIVATNRGLNRLTVLFAIVGLLLTGVQIWQGFL